MTTVEGQQRPTMTISQKSTAPPSCAGQSRATRPCPASKKRPPTTEPETRAAETPAKRRRPNLQRGGISSADLLAVQEAEEFTTGLRGQRLARSVKTTENHLTTPTNTSAPSRSGSAGGSAPPSSRRQGQQKVGPQTDPPTPTAASTGRQAPTGELPRTDKQEEIRRLLADRPRLTVEETPPVSKGEAATSTTEPDSPTRKPGHIVCVPAPARSGKQDLRRAEAQQQTQKERITEGSSRRQPSGDGTNPVPRSGTDGSTPSVTVTLAASSPSRTPPTTKTTETAKNAVPNAANRKKIIRKPPQDVPPTTQQQNAASTSAQPSRPGEAFPEGLPDLFDLGQPGAPQLQGVRTTLEGLVADVTKQEAEAESMRQQSIQMLESLRDTSSTLSKWFHSMEVMVSRSRQQKRDIALLQQTAIDAGRKARQNVALLGNALTQLEEADKRWATLTSLLLPEDGTVTFDVTPPGADGRHQLRLTVYPQATLDTQTNTVSTTGTRPHSRSSDQAQSSARSTSSPSRTTPVTDRQAPPSPTTTAQAQRARTSPRSLETTPKQEIPSKPKDLPATTTTMTESSPTKGHRSAREESAVGEDGAALSEEDELRLGLQEGALPADKAFLDKKD